MNMTTTITRSTVIPFNFLSVAPISQIVSELEAGLVPRIDLVRTKGESVIGVMLSKAVYDNLIFNATGPVPDYTAIVETDDYVQDNAIQVLRVFTGEQFVEPGYMSYALTITANSSAVKALILDKEYYDALIALQ